MAVALLALSGTPSHAGPVRVLFERNVDGQAGNDLAVVSYPTLTDLIDNSISITNFTQVDIDPNYSIGGYTYDGSAYRVLFQRNVDGQAGNDLAVVSYPTLNDLIDNTISITNFTQVDVDPNYRVAGVTFDGGAYRVLFERKVDGQAGNDLAIVTYPTLSDLIGNTVSITNFTQVDIDPNYSVVGFAVDGGTYRVLFERDVDGQAGNDLALVSYPTLSDLIDNTVSITQFTLVDIDPNYGVAGFLIEPDISGDPGGGPGGGPGSVDEPHPLFLFTFGLAGLGLAVRLRSGRCKETGA